MTVVLGCMGWTAASLPAAAQPASSLFADLGTDAVTLAPSPLSKTGEPAWITEPIPAEATGFVVQGTTPDRNLTGWVRFEDGPWRALRIVFSATGDTFFAGFHGEDVFTAGRFETRFETRASVRLSAAGVFDNRKDADREKAVEQREGERGNQGEAPPEETGEAHLQKTGIIVPPLMYDRSAWKADPFRGDPVALARPDYRNMAFHHAAGFWATTHEEGLAQLKAIQDLHQNIRGWSDIGYHFVLDQSGRLYQGRPFLQGDASLESAPALAMGAHVGGHNTGNIGVCMLGCYHPPYIARCIDTLAPPTFDSLAVTFSFLSENYGVSPDNLRGHGPVSGRRYELSGGEHLGDLRRSGQAHPHAARNGQCPARPRRACRPERRGRRGASCLGISRRPRHRRLSHRARGRPNVRDYFRGRPVAAERFHGRGATYPGQISYRLYARSAGGREQLLATAAAVLERPEQHVLTENYPDPFLHATTIRYYLPQDGIVHLTVFDALGRSVANLVEGATEGEQWHHIPFDATGLPSGTYFYRLRIEGFSGTAYNETRSLVRMR